MSRGFDSDSLENQLLFSLPMFEGSGTATVRDVSRAHHPVTQTHAPVWTQLSPSGLWCLDFDGASDCVKCDVGSCSDLDFTTGDFSGVAWEAIDTLKNNATMLYRYSASKGWFFGSHLNGALWAATCDAGGIKVSQSGAGEVQASAWQLVGFSRSGTSVRVYVNGRDVTASAATHNAIVSVNQHLYICYNSSSAVYLDGRLWNPRIWSRALSPAEHRSIWLRERHLFGV